MTDTFLSSAQGFGVIAGYGVASFALTRLLAWQKTTDKVQFLLAGRNLGTWESALSVAATWIWAPALFVAAEKAYTQGFAGVFWFTVPNVACLIIFAHFAARIRHLFPIGFTLSHYIRTRYSRRVQGLYLFQLSGLAACSFAVQLLAGGKVLSFLTGMPFGWITVILALMALSYSLLSGLKASAVTDCAQMVIILGVSLTVVPWAVYEAGGLQSIAAGMGGHTGDFASLFAGDGPSVAWRFGIPVTIGLLAGPFGDQSFWQRAFATKEACVRPAFIRGALIFAIVPITLSVLGFIAAGKGWAPSDTGLVNLEAVKRLLPSWVMLPVVFMLLSGLVSTLDSNLCAFSSLAGHDFLGGGEEHDGAISSKKIVSAARWGMLALAIVGVGIANIPSLKILYLFLFYGTLRASTLLPTILTMSVKWVTERGMFCGILCAILIGLPVSAYGNFTRQDTWVVAGAVLTASISGIVVLMLRDRSRGLGGVSD